MKTETLAKMVHQVAKPLGYRRRGGLFWRSRDDGLTTMIHLQRSRWGGGMYVNLGLMPTEHITKAAPPGPEYWPLSMRAAAIESPHQEEFRDLEQDDDDTMPPEEMAGAFTWLLAWMDENFGDADRIRRALLGEITHPLISSRLTAAADGEWIMLDWARGKLKPPRHDYKGTPYGRSWQAGPYPYLGIWPFGPPPCGPLQFPVIPHTTPPIWPETRPGRFAAAILRNSTDLLDAPEAADAIAKCRIALLGMPDDTGVGLNGGRLGAAEGPNAFRAALSRYGAAIPMAEVPLDTGLPMREAPYPHVFDAGNIIPAEDIHETHARVTEAVAAILDRGLLPVGIGGGHDLTFPFVRAVAQRFAPIAGVYLDAHLDVREEVGSGMPFRRLIEDCGVTSLTCIGVDELANTREHFEWFTAHGGRTAHAELDHVSPLPFAPLPHYPSRPAGEPEHIFVSLDLDVLDAAYAPGVSAMNPCGLTPHQVARYVRAAGRSPAVRCFDIMELSPPHDEGGRTARLAARMFLEFLRGFAERPT